MRASVQSVVPACVSEEARTAISLQGHPVAVDVISGVEGGGRNDDGVAGLYYFRPSGHGAFAVGYQPRIQVIVDDDACRMSTYCGTLDSGQRRDRSSLTLATGDPNVTQTGLPKWLKTQGHIGQRLTGRTAHRIS